MTIPLAAVGGDGDASSHARTGSALALPHQQLSAVYLRTCAIGKLADVLNELGQWAVEQSGYLGSGFR